MSLSPKQVKICNICKTTWNVISLLRQLIWKVSNILSSLETQLAYSWLWYLIFAALCLMTISNWPMEIIETEGTWSTLLPPKKKHWGWSDGGESSGGKGVKVFSLCWRAAVGFLNSSLNWETMGRKRPQSKLLPTHWPWRAIQVYWLLGPLSFAKPNKLNLYTGAVVSLNTCRFQSQLDHIQVLYCTYG